MKVETVAEQLFFVTVRIETEVRDENNNVIHGVGTAFIVHYKWGENKEGDFLITNKHVIDGASKGRFFFTHSESNQPVLGETHNVEIDNFEKAWHKNRNREIDVAVMPLSYIQEKIEATNQKIFFRSISEDFFLDDKKLADLDAIQDVIFVGYPSGMYDKKNYLPLVRKGTTATPLNVDYNGFPQFLIDASVFPGSSGSPVFIFDKGSYSPRNGGLIAGNRLILLGVIARVFTRTDNGKLEFTEVPTKIIPIIKTEQMIDIGLVFKASAITETIKQLLQDRGEIE